LAKHVIRNDGVTGSSPVRHQKLCTASDQGLIHVSNSDALDDHCERPRSNQGQLFCFVVERVIGHGKDAIDLTEFHVATLVDQSLMLLG
jgi:hypothetical protein